jgi:hypothetical protein
VHKPRGTELLLPVPVQFGVGHSVTTARVLSTHVADELVWPPTLTEHSTEGEIETADSLPSHAAPGYMCVIR